MSVDYQAEWTADYEQKLYLRNAPEAYLRERYATLIKLLWSTDRDGNAQQPRDLQRRIFVLKLIYQLLLEQTRRGITPSASTFDEAAMRAEGSRGYTPPMLTNRLPESPQGFSKFGPKTFIRPAYERGSFRISPASSFLDPSLNAAQQDQELQHYVVTPNESLGLRLHVRDMNGTPSVITPTNGQLFRYMNVSDFFVWCCSWSCDARTFHDFNYDALLFIHNEAAFADRLCAAVHKARPDWVAKHGPIRYYDPYNINQGQLEPIFVKNIKYLYQNEYRFSWTVPPGTTMDHLFIEIGSLSDIAHYFEKL